MFLKAFKLRPYRARAMLVASTAARGKRAAGSAVRCSWASKWRSIPRCCAWTRTCNTNRRASRTWRAPCWKAGRSSPSAHGTWEGGGLGFDWSVLRRVVSAGARLLAWFLAPSDGPSQRLLLREQGGLEAGRGTVEPHRLQDRS